MLGFSVLIGVLSSCVLTALALRIVVFIVKIIA